MPAPLDYTVTITEQDIYEADASHLNGQEVAKFIRTELQNVGKHFQDDDWQQRLLKYATVTVNRNEKGVQLQPLIKNKIAHFSDFHDGVLFYEVGNFRFPIPIEELDGAAINATEKASVFLKWIKRAVNDINDNVETEPHSPNYLSQK